MGEIGCSSVRRGVARNDLGPVRGGLPPYLSLIVCGLVVSTYNRLVALKNLCENGFAQIEVQLRRRYDLIPNLVECVKGYMSHERQTLENVIAARNQAAAGLAQATQNPSDLQQSARPWSVPTAALTGAMGRLSFVMEAYPELKANENVASLTEELTTTENKVAFCARPTTTGSWATTPTERAFLPSSLRPP